MAQQLSLATLDGLPAGVARPAYARDDLSPGILHVGVGNFHRAHQAVYLDRLFSRGRDHDWAILGAGVMPGDARIRETLERQDYLTTVVEQSAESSTARVTSPMTGFLPAADAEAIIAAMADPAIRIVSLTVTEGGYFVSAVTGHFDAAHPAIAQDAATPEAPATVFGMIVAALGLRREAGTPPFTVMSCDNLPHNGVVTREAVVGLARQVAPDLADWIEANVSFPNGMVDRITPATGDRERRLVAEDWGVDDAWPVFCEDFIQWVLEDDFPQGRPALEEVGVQFVPDVAPYERMKIRILNGGHAIIAYPAALLDIEYVHEAMETPLVRAFLQKVEREEILPIVGPVPDTDTAEYFATIERRFANPKIGDTVRRLCLDGSNRQPKFIIPSVADRLSAKDPVEGLALASALWCRYCYGVSESGAEIAPNDPNWDRLQPVARQAREDPAAWLAMEDIYGAVGRSDPFRTAFAAWLTALWTEGVEATVGAYLEDAKIG